jgi:hypothetical protein
MGEPPWSSNHLKSDIPKGGLVIASQNSRNFSTRFPGELPAIRAEFAAPIEIPATQSGCKFASARA